MGPWEWMHLPLCNMQSSIVFYHFNRHLGHLNVPAPGASAAADVRSSPQVQFCTAARSYSYGRIQQATLEIK